MITAAQAKEMAQKAPERLEQKQLMDIMRDIIRDSQHGRMSMNAYYPLFPSTPDKLRELGFEVTPISGGVCISWGTQQEDFDVSSEINDRYASLPAVQYTVSDPVSLTAVDAFMQSYPIRLTND